MFRRLPLAAPACLAFVAFAVACGLPRDPEDTLRRIGERGTLRVGVVERDPAIAWREGAPAGPEAELVAALAADLGARVLWVEAPAEELFAGLESFTLDLVVGAVDGASPWKKRLAFTRPTLETAYRVGFAPGQEGPLAGRAVATAAAGDLAPRLRRREATVRLVGEVATAEPPVAAEEWQLEVRGLQIGEELTKQRWVWAVPPGENGWLHRVNRFLVARRATYEEGLRAAAAGKR